MSPAVTHTPRTCPSQPYCLFSSQDLWVNLLTDACPPHCHLALIPKDTKTSLLGFIFIFYFFCRKYFTDYVLSQGP